MNISTLSRILSEELTTLSESPRLEAELLITHILKCERSYLYAHSDQVLNESEIALILNLRTRRLAQEPLAYILGYKEFWSLNLKLTQDTLIPRPETESVVEWVLNHFPMDSLEVADLGTGSGAIALALAQERPQWRISATDQSNAALIIAEENARLWQFNHIKFYQGSWCKALPHKNYHLIISNPPYIAETDPHLQQLRFEPSTALTAKEEGLADLKEIINTAADYLCEQGTLVLEHGYQQGLSVRNLLAAKGYCAIRTHQDLSQQERFSVAKKNSQ